MSFVISFTHRAIYNISIYRHFNPKQENRPTINTTDHSKLKFHNSISSQGISPPSPIATSISPKHIPGKPTHPTRATHCYTPEGLVISEPHRPVIEKSRSQDLENTNFKTTVDDLYKQQSLMKLITNKFDNPPKLPPRSNETSEISFDKGNIQNQHTDSVIENLQKPKSTTVNNNQTLANSQATVPAKKPQSIFTQQQQQQQQHKPLGYREISPPPMQTFSFQQQNNIRQVSKPQQAPQKPQRNFSNSNPPKRQAYQFVKYPNTYQQQQQQQQQQPAIINYPTSHWV